MKFEEKLVQKVEEFGYDGEEMQMLRSGARLAVEFLLSGEQLEIMAKSLHEQHRERMGFILPEWERLDEQSHEQARDSARAMLVAVTK